MNMALGPAPVEGRRGGCCAWAMDPVGGEPPVSEAPSGGGGAAIDQLGGGGGVASPLRSLDSNTFPK